MQTVQSTCTSCCCTLASTAGRQGCRPSEDTWFGMVRAKDNGLSKMTTGAHLKTQSKYNLTDCSRRPCDSLEVSPCSNSIDCIVDNQVVAPAHDQRNTADIAKCVVPGDEARAKIIKIHSLYQVAVMATKMMSRI
eukprot:TRINITY_DN10640_c0_g3_i1.p1 TRINITY_DN10640_c0_g3~~TRINITY_DN10640_c0_g3_i1.p1  ORF type:complete len:135 (+),score=13.30 TRINITY_DN10640_c0_g3_i1:51-455(+)